LQAKEIQCGIREEGKGRGIAIARSYAVAAKHPLPPFAPPQNNN